MEKDLINIAGLRLSFHEHSCPGAYMIIHRETGVRYVGSTGNLYSRLSTHLSSLKLKKHYSKRLQELYNQSPEIDIAITLADTRHDAYVLEQKFMDAFADTGLLTNKALGAIPGQISGRFVEGYQEQRIEKLRETWKDKDKCQARSELTKSRWANSDYHLKHSMANKRTAMTEEGRAKLKRMHDAHLKPVEVNGVVYSGTPAVADAFKLTYSAAKNRIARGFTGWTIKRLAE